MLRFTRVAISNGLRLLFRSINFWHQSLAMATIALLTLAGGSVHGEESTLMSINQTMQEFIDQGQISGAVTLAARRGKIVHLGASGLADLETRRPMQVASLFRIASMTKPITATAMMILADEGKLSIDDPVEKYIPSFADAKTKTGESVRGLTIRRLLTHTSGLVGEQKCEDSLEATVEMLAKREFGFQPGEKWEYGPSLNVCGRIVEIVSGHSFENFLAERIFSPLGMSDTVFHLTPELRQRVATVYDIDSETQSLVVPDELPFATGEPGTVPNPSGGLFSTASDMGRFYQMILDGGAGEETRIVSADAVRQMTTVQTPDLRTGFTPGNGWGLGWCIVRDPEDITGMLSPGTFGHGGKFGTQGWVDPDRQMIFVLMIARNDLPNSDGSEIRKAFQQAAVEGVE